MKKIIDGKIYDIKTAKLIASEHGRSLFHNLDKKESMYRTKNGQWFLHTERRPSSHYTEWCARNNVKPVDDAFDYGEDIELLRPDEVLHLLVYHGKSGHLGRVIDICYCKVNDQWYEPPSSRYEDIDFLSPEEMLKLVERKLDLSQKSFRDQIQEA